MRDTYLFVDWTYSYYNKDGDLGKVPWQRIRVTDIEARREQCKNFSIFTTIQMFKNDRKVDGEQHYAPIYFDFDAKDNVEQALEDTRKVVQFFAEVLGVSKEHIRIWFSGSKGFHVTITPELFGIRPSDGATYIIKNACKHAAAELDLSSFDKSVYSVPRMWRLFDSIHEKTRLHCVELYPHEIHGDLSDIRDIAKSVRGQLYEDSEYANVEENPLCVVWFQRFREEYEHQKELQNLRPRHTITTIEGQDPVCVSDLLSNSIRKSGTRNQAQMALASYYKDTGVPQTDAVKRIVEWAKKVPKELTTMAGDRKILANVKSTVDTVFGKGGEENKYAFACQFIRAIGAGTDKPIACLYEKCKFIKNEEDQEPQNIIDLKLSEGTRAPYIGKRVRMAIMVAGRDEVPYGIPGKLRVTCKPELQRENSVCAGCGIAPAGGNFEYAFNAKNKTTLSLIDTSDQVQKALLRGMFGIPKNCSKHKIEILEHTNVRELLAIPRIDFRPDNINQEEEYVYRRCFYVGHDVKANEEYIASGYTYPDPRSQHLVHLFDTMEPVADDVARFNPNEDSLEALKKFQFDGFAEITI